MPQITIEVTDDELELIEWIAGEFGGIEEYLRDHALREPMSYLVSGILTVEESELPRQADLQRRLADHPTYVKYVGQAARRDDRLRAMGIAC